jgi:GntR family transcriptional regulator
MNLHLELNPALGTPVYRQVMDGIRALVASGQLRPGDRVPSIRELSGSLRINPSSAVKAYSELQHEGVLELDQGRGTFVSPRGPVVERTRAALLGEAVEALLVRTRTYGCTDEEVRRALEQGLAVQKKGKKR